MRLMFAILLLLLRVPLESGLRIQTTTAGKQTSPKDTEFCRDKPSTWMTPSGVTFDEDVHDWMAFVKKGPMPRSFTSLFERLEAEHNQEESEFLRRGWQTSRVKGLILSIPPSVASPHQIVLEEGDALMFAYRVEQKDVLFDISVLETMMEDDDEYNSTPVHSQDKVFSEYIKSSTGSSVVGFWKPPSSRFSVNESAVELTTELDLEVTTEDAVPVCTIDLIWDNTYSWITSKKVVALVGILRKVDESNTKPWLDFWGGPITMSNYSLSLSMSHMSFAAALADVADCHPLDKRQCVEAKSRVAETTGFERDMALLGYLVEAGLKPTDDLKESVLDAIANDCDISAADLTLSSNVDFLSESECQVAMARAGNKQGDLLKHELKRYLKELERNPGEEMIKRVLEQIAAECAPASEQRLSPEQCRGVDAFLRHSNGAASQIEMIKTALRAFGKPEHQQLIVEVCKQMVEGCGPPTDTIEDVPVKPQPAEIEKKPLTLNAEECRRAKEALDGKASMYAENHVKTWLEKEGKESDAKATNIVLDKLQGDCGALREPEPRQTDDNMLVEEVSPAGAELVLVEVPQLKDSEKPGTVSSGTIRRQDFVEDELMKTGLTEEDLKCFVLLLYGDVDECNVAPKSKSNKMLTQEFLKDSRVKKYAMMLKFKQTKEMIENKLTMDQANLLKEGLTEADIDCLKKLLFDGVKDCDASPAGKILGPEFVDTDNPLFKKYRMMYKFKQTKTMVLGRIAQDKAALEELGFSQTDMDCFVQLLFKETTQCICGPAQRSESTSKEAKNLAMAKETQEKLASLLDGDSGLMPAILPSNNWVTEVFEAIIPADETPKQKVVTTGAKKQLPSFLDGKIQLNLNIILSLFPKTDQQDDPVVWEGVLAEIARGEFTFERAPAASPEVVKRQQRGDLETIQRALHDISDGDLKDVKPHVAKITDEFDASHRFAKALVPYQEKEGGSLEEIVKCMLASEIFDGPLLKKIRQRLDGLVDLQNYYKDIIGKLASTLATASAGFIVQILNSRLAMTDSSTKHAKESIELYDTILREFRRMAGFSDGAETVTAVVPLLALFNVIIDKSKRLRPNLDKKHPELAKKLSPTYLELFKRYIQQVVAEEARQAVHEKPEEPLEYTECEAAKKVVADAKDEKFAEVALVSFLMGIQKTAMLDQVKEQLKRPCVKQVVEGPLTQQECEDGLELVRKPNKKFQGIKLDEYVTKILQERNMITQKAEAIAQVDAGCPSGKPAEPIHKISSLHDQCIAVLDTPKPSESNSVRGAVKGVAETQREVKKCMDVMPPLQQASFDDLMGEAQIVLDTSQQIQDQIFEVMIQSSGPFLPHNSRGDVDKNALWDLVKKMPEAGGTEDKKRIEGESVASKYKISDFLDDHSLRHAFRTICSALIATRV